MTPEPLDVRTRADLAAFVDELLIDLQEHPEQWENRTLEQYLDALSRCLTSLDGWCRNNAPQISPDEAAWQLFAVALDSATVYE